MLLRLSLLTGTLIGSLLLLLMLCLGSQNLEQREELRIRVWLRADLAHAVDPRLHRVEVAAEARPVARLRGIGRAPHYAIRPRIHTHRQPRPGVRLEQE